jgi:ADP-ribosylglycohydrolase
LVLIYVFNVLLVKKIEKKITKITDMTHLTNMAAIGFVVSGWLISKDLLRNRLAK